MRQRLYKMNLQSFKSATTRILPIIFKIIHESKIEYNLRHCYTMQFSLQLSHNAIARQVAEKNALLHFAIFSATCKFFRLGRIVWHEIQDTVNKNK